jgi:hypothetical protein
LGAFECTDPEAVFLQFTQVGVTNGTVFLRWRGNPAMTRFLESTADLSSPNWTLRATRQPGETANSSASIPVDGASTCFRLRATHP